MQKAEEKKKKRKRKRSLRSILRIKTKKAKKGRRNRWPEHLVDDLVDIILENDKYKKKLLLTNVKKRKEWSTLFKSNC